MLGKGIDMPMVDRHSLDKLAGDCQLTHCLALQGNDNLIIKYITTGMGES